MSKLIYSDFFVGFPSMQTISSLSENSDLESVEKFAAAASLIQYAVYPVACLDDEMLYSRWAV